MVQRSLKRPKGMPLLVCDCTRPKPWPLFVRHTPRSFEVPLEVSHTDDVIIFEVEWYVQALRFHFLPPESSEEGERLCGRITGRCPVCSTAFILRFPVHVFPTVQAFFALISDERLPVKVVSAKARRATPDERTQKARHYITYDALRAISGLPTGDVRVGGDAKQGYTVTVAGKYPVPEPAPDVEDDPFWEDVPAPSEPLPPTLQLRQHMPQVSDADRENLRRATITINCAGECGMETWHTADWRREMDKEQGWPFGK